MTIQEAKFFEIKSDAGYPDPILIPTDDPHVNEKPSKWWWPFTILFLVFSFSGHAAQKVYMQDFVATIVSIYDGDTITVDIDGLPEVFSKAIGIRVYGVDTPEIKGPQKAEAIKARDFVRGMCPIGSKVKLTNIRRDKYFRLDADVICAGKSVGEELLKLGMGKAYFGGKKE